MSSIRFNQIAVAALALALLAGCHARRPSSQSPAPAAHRIISMAPNLTELLFALGAGDRIIGVTEFCTYPPQVADLPRVGALLNPNYEVLFSLRPDLVVMLPSHREVKVKLESQGIRCLTVRDESIEDILESIDLIGAAIGEPKQAAKLSRRLQAELKPRPVAEEAAKPRILLVIGRDPHTVSRVFAVGGGGYLDEMVTRAGGRNVFGDIRQYYPEVAAEQILRRDPDIILEMRPGQSFTEQQRADLLADWQQLPTLRALKSNRIYLWNEDYLLIPGPRITKTYARLIELLRGTDAPSP